MVWEFATQNLRTKELPIKICAKVPPINIFLIQKIRPGRLNTFPSWDIPLVLSHLYQESFKALQEADVVAFLFAIHSVKVREIQELAAKEMYLSITADKSCS